jgi:hypothetical protein
MVSKRVSSRGDIGETSATHPGSGGCSQKLDPDILLLQMMFGRSILSSDSIRENSGIH